MESEKRWYVIHTYSGYENKVSANLERKVHSLGMENEIFRIVIPMENEVEVKDGKKRSVQRKVFQLRFGAVTEEGTGSNLCPDFVQIFGNQVSLGAVDNHIVQVKFFTQAHSGKNIVCSVGVKMHLNLSL